MAAYFLSNASGAAGANNGSSWANAYKTMDALLARPIVAGDTVWVGDDHNEVFTQSAAKIWTLPGTAANPVYLYCVDHTVASPTSANLKKTAFIGAGSASVSANTTWGGSFYAYGITFAAGVGSNGGLNLFMSAANHQVVLEECTLYHATSGGAGNYFNCINSLHINCVYRYKANGHWISMQNVTSIGCRLDAQDTGGVFTPTGAWIIAAGNLFWNCEDCDFSALMAPIFPVTTASNVSANFKRCRFGTLSAIQLTPTTGPRFGITANLVQCDTGSGFWRNDRCTTYGRQLTETKCARVNGAQDYGQGVSHRIITYSYTRWVIPYDAIPIAIWNDVVGTVNATLEFAIDPRGFAALPNNDEVWFDVEYLDSGSVTVGKNKRGSKANNLEAGTPLAESEAAWEANARANSTAYAVGDIIKVASNPGRIFVCTVAGTTESEEGGGWAIAVDGDFVNDGATFAAMWRCKHTVAVTAGKEGYIYVTPKVAKAMSNVGGVYVDPLIVLS